MRRVANQSLLLVRNLPAYFAFWFALLSPLSGQKPSYFLCTASGKTNSSPSTIFIVLVSPPLTLCFGHCLSTLIDPF